MARIQLAPIHTRLLKTYTVLGASGVAIPHTGTLTETTLSPTITIAAGWMGLNGVVRIWSLWSATNNANNKTFRVKFGGTTYQQIVITTGLSYNGLVIVRNRNSASSQVGLGISGSGIGSGGAAVVTSAINTASPVNVTFTAQLANIADTLTLEAYLVELYYGA